jgi:outer membrane protein OmpA-like peptidoglycan-associated protein
MLMDVLVERVEARILRVEAARDHRASARHVGGLRRARQERQQRPKSSRRGYPAPYWPRHLHWLLSPRCFPVWGQKILEELMLIPSCSVTARSLAAAAAVLCATTAIAQQAPAVTVPFTAQSVEIAEAGRGALDGLAKSLSERGVRQLEVRGYASGEDTGDARKVALARALSVRSYLIDQGVTARIEVSATAQPARTAPKERVDVVVP